MTDLRNLPPGSRIRWVRDDPYYGDYNLPSEYRGQSATIMAINAESATTRRYPEKTVYHARFEPYIYWYIICTMVELEEGPW